MCLVAAENYGLLDRILHEDSVGKDENGHRDDCP